MPWEPLASRLSKLPHVLAGPILRKVTPQEVTVWVALRKPGKVTLNVTDLQGVSQKTGNRRTVAIGRHLHLAAVTAREGKDLGEGIVYQYDLVFDFDGGLSSSLKSSTFDAPLSYLPSGLPSFALPPKDLSLLRLLQGSCRKPHGEGSDLLPVINRLIKETATNAFARPHQLLLTGDQIYADEVSYAMSLMVSDASDALLEWHEQMPQPPSTPRLVRDLHPELRAAMLKKIGLTSEDVHLHLVGLGEYLADYLFVWSDVLWPVMPATLPAFDDIRAAINERIRAAGGDKDGLPESKREAITKETAVLQSFSLGLPEVRRVLANVPSYMMFDDHEVTDDWNMTRAFCRNVYGSDLGLRLIQNGLAAYTLCQHWGNVPDDFEPPKPGRRLLALLDTANPLTPNAFQGKAVEYDAFTESFREVLGIHKAAAVKARDDHAVFHDANSLRYNFSVEGSGHQVIFTDTRTWRSYPQPSSTTHLLTKNRQTDQFKEQILDMPATGTRQLLVVVSTNAPPVQPIRGATRHDSVSNNLAYHPDVYEAWDLPSESFDHLLVALTSKLPLDSNGRHTGSVILLSGDVHHSFATRIIYRATKRFFDDAKPRGAEAVIAQLVASSFKKQTDNTVGFHRQGYFAAPYAWIANRMIRRTLTEGYVGWNFPAGTEEKVAIIPLGLDDTIEHPMGKGTMDVTPNDPINGLPDSRKVDLIKAPHYRYRLDYLRPDEQFFDGVPPPIKPLPESASPEARKAAARDFHRSMSYYRKLNKDSPPTVVGVNNFGEIRFAVDAAGRQRVEHMVRWFDPTSGQLKMTVYSVRLDINSPTDSEFADIKARKEP